jgi:Ca2+-binding RTX toxin-like protein
MGGTGTDTFLLTGDGDKVDGELPKSTDWVDYGLSAAAADVDLELGTGTVAGQSTTDHIAGVRSMVGSPFGDTLRGDSGQTVAIGNRGNDTIEGRDGNDSLRGGTGDDTLDGGPGFDNLDGWLGVDTCINGEGFAMCDVISP